jgi:hypothetical protein
MPVANTNLGLLTLNLTTPEPYSFVHIPDSVNPGLFEIHNYRSGEVLQNPLKFQLLANQNRRFKYSISVPTLTVTV